MKIQNILPQDKVLVKSFEIFFDLENLLNRNAAFFFGFKCILQETIEDNVVYVFLVEVLMIHKRTL